MAILMSVLFTFGYIVLPSVSSLRNGKRILSRISKYDGNLIVDTKGIEEIKRNINENKNCAVEVKKNSSKIRELQEKINRKNIEEKILPLVDILKQNTNEKNLEILNFNIKTLKIKDKHYSLKYFGTSYYLGEKNKIVYSNFKSLAHELLHASTCLVSSKKHNHIVLSGFRQQNNSDYIGIGLNEGYTELLNSRIFDKEKKPHGYFELVQMTKMLETFFDDPKEMEDYYFNCNLPAFINYFEKFAEREEIIKILVKMDLLVDGIVETLPFAEAIRKIDIYLSIYNWGLKSNLSIEKKEQLRSMLEEDRLLRFVMQYKNYKLNKQSPYDDKIVNKKSKKKTLSKIKNWIME